MYSISFGAKVVEDFENAHPRGWAFFCNHYAEFTPERIARIVAGSQDNPGPWVVTKACVKLADRLLTTRMYSEKTPENSELIMKNISALKVQLLNSAKKSVKL